MKQRNRKQRGFTLVELLVVISIIGMLMALLLPAVMNAREAGRSNTCRNNLKNIGVGFVNYETARTNWPGYWNDLGTGFNENRSWTFVLLPYMDQRAMFDLYTTKDNTGALSVNGTSNADINVTLEVMICPSAPPEAVGTAPTHYVANVGQPDMAISGTRTTRDYLGNGVFHYAGPLSATTERINVMGSAYVTGADGQGTTLMISENADADTWVDPRERYAGFGYGPTTPAPTPATPPNTASSTAEPMGINYFYGQSKVAGGTPVDNTSWMRASAYHPGGVNVMFCDSHVRFLSDQIGYDVYQALMTPKGQAAFNNSTATQFVTSPLTSAHPATKIIDARAIP